MKLVFAEKQHFGVSDTGDPLILTGLHATDQATVPGSAGFMSYLVGHQVDWFSCELSA